ncbi:MAG: YqiA/YcfP family alpha/beta fold hydrolase [Sulfuricellaceae bacterium]|jgi:predicted esterase YcpF (UPF0227 family)
MILYLHGLNSAPASHKAQLLATAMGERGIADRLLVPQLPHEPRRAIALAERLASSLGDDLTLVGSSLGGFYALFLAEQLGLKAVLVNPAVDAPKLARQWLGPQKNLYTGEEWVLTEAHAAQLAALDVAVTRPERYLLLVETGDEILPWRRAVEKFAGARQIVVEGGDHGFASFPEHIGTILRFAGLAD